MASEKAVAIATASEGCDHVACCEAGAKDSDSGYCPTCNALRLDAAFPVMLRERVEGMSDDTLDLLGSCLDSMVYPDDSKSARSVLLRALGVEP